MLCYMSHNYIPIRHRKLLARICLSKCHNLTKPNIFIDWPYLWINIDCILDDWCAQDTAKKALYRLHANNKDDENTCSTHFFVLLPTSGHVFYCTPPAASHNPLNRSSAIEVTAVAVVRQAHSWNAVTGACFTSVACTMEAQGNALPVMNRGCHNTHVWFPLQFMPETASLSYQVS